MNKPQLPIESVLSLTELTELLKRNAQQAVLQHIEEFRYLVSVSGEFATIPDGGPYPTRYGAVLTDRTSGSNASVLVDIPEDVYSRSKVTPGDRVRVRGIITTNLFKSVFTLRIKASTIEAMDAPIELEKVRAERANIDHLKTLVGKRKPLPYKAPIKISLIFSRASEVKVKEDFLDQVKSIREYIDIEELPVSMSSSLELTNAVDRATGAILVLARGGGNAADLSVFDDRVLLERVANKDAYRITGIGHSGDRTLLDLVVDFAASTPSAAGTYIAQHLNDYLAVQRENAKLSRRHDQIVASSDLIHRKAEEDLKRSVRRQHRWSIAAFSLGAI